MKERPTLIILAACLAAAIGLVVLARMRAAAHQNPDAALYRALREGDFDQVRPLLDQGASARTRVGRQDQGAGDGALSPPISVGRLDIVRLLLQRGADPNGTVDYGRTPLSLACEESNTEVVRELLDHGARIDGRSLGCETPLMIAVQCGRRKTVELLLARHANVSLRSPRGRTAEDFARLTHPELLALFRHQ